MARRRDYSTDARLPNGLHRDWGLIERIVQEIERKTDQWPHAETELNVSGERNMWETYATVLDAKVDLGEDIRDVRKVEISRKDYTEYGSSGYWISIDLADSEDSQVYVSGPVESVCIELARGVQAFVLECVKHPALPEGRQRDDPLDSRLQYLHPAIRREALSRIRSGHGDNAVEEACKSVGERLRQLSGLNMDGVALAGAVLSPGGQAHLNFGNTETDKSIQQGYMCLAQGLFLAARNPRAHRPSDSNFNLDEVIEWLSVASAIHRALDRFG